MMDWSSYLDQEQSRFIDELTEFVRIPSVSAKPENTSDVYRAAEWSSPASRRQVSKRPR